MELTRKVSLQNFNTLGVACDASYFAAVKDKQDLELLLADGEHGDKRRLVLGEGSNVVLPEKFNGLVLHPVNKGIEVQAENEDSVLLKVAAGESWDDFVTYTVNNAYYGLENLTFIPGSVGAAPVQNIGAYGVEVESCIESVEVFNFDLGQFEVLDNQACEFSYRESIFKKNKDRYMVYSIVFKLSKKKVLNLSYAALNRRVEALSLASVEEDLSQQTVAELVKEIRQEKLPDPALIPNAGSFFKNPIVSDAHYQDLRKKNPDLVAFAVGSEHSQWKLSAGWMIEHCGWKGKDNGKLNAKVGMYEKHALVLISDGACSQEDVLDFSDQIKQDVKREFLVELEIEPLVIRG